MKHLYQGCYRFQTGWNELIQLINEVLETPGVQERLEIEGFRGGKIEREEVREDQE